MFRSKTVFVLGAGASAEVGLPVGAKLKGIIAEKINVKFGDFGQQSPSGDYDIYKALWKHSGGTNLNDYLRAAWQLSDALTLAISIDNLLDTYQGDKYSELCGKLGIVKSILEAEKESSIYLEPNSRGGMSFRGLSSTWFSGFFQILTEGISKREVESIFENVSIINFNYDRCVEHFLFESLKTYYALEPDDAARLVSKIKILHPYGKVGELPWQGGSVNQRVQFGSESTNLLALAERIKTFTERVEEDEEIKEFRSLLKDAEIIVFLGFAFHRQNLKLLKSDDFSAAKRVYATALGASKSDCQLIEEDIRELLNVGAFLVQQDARIELRNDLECGMLFREYWRSFTAGI